MNNQKQIHMPKKDDPQSTQSQSVRIELLKMVYRHDRSPTEQIEKAKEFEVYVTGNTAK